MNSITSTHYYSILKNLQAIDYALLDLSIYLEAHPDDIESLNLIKRYHQERKELIALYEKNYNSCPRLDQSLPTTSFNWTQTLIM